MATTVSATTAAATTENVRRIWQTASNSKPISTVATEVNNETINRMF